jgi:hypothetical protein
MKSNLLEKIRQSQEMKNVEEYMNLNENSYPLPVNQGSNDHPIINSNNSFIEVQFNLVITLVILSVTIIALLIITLFYKYCPDKCKCSKKLQSSDAIYNMLPSSHPANNQNRCTGPFELARPTAPPPPVPSNNRLTQHQNQNIRTAQFIQVLGTNSVLTEDDEA